MAEIGEDHDVRGERMEFRVLGPLEVRRSGTPTGPLGARQRRLLAILLLNANAAVPITHLAEQLWDDPPPTARRQVHNAVAALRRSLAGPDGADTAIVTTDVGYQMHVGETQLDMFRFAAALREADRAQEQGRREEAVRLLRAGLDEWTGPALAGVGGRHVASAAAGLEEQRLTAVERLAALRLALGQAASIVGELTELVAQHPLRETLRGSLMLALHGSGRQPDALAVYEQGRRLLADELGLDPSNALRELHEQILRGHPEAGPAEEVAAARPETTRPPDDPREPPVREAGRPRRCFLPFDTRDFAGRGAEIDRILAEANTEPGAGPTVLAINGMGGIGKTALAVHLAHRLAESYPAGQYFIDLHGFTPGHEPLDPAVALDLLLRAADVPADQIPPDLPARAALWRSQVAGRQVLLLLDNAVDDAQVRPLLPSSVRSLVLVTSRRRLAALEGAVPLSLDVLPAPDAVALFGQIAGRGRAEADPRAVAHTVELCGRLPLAIRIAASRLRHRPSWTVAHLVELLRDQQRRTRFLAVGDRDVAAVMSLSYRCLDPVQRRVFRLLGLHPGEDVDTYAVAALAGTSLVDTEEILEELFECNLLMQHTAGRYHLHDLIRDCARDMLDQHDAEHERNAARHLLFDYYLTLTHVLCRPLARGPSRFEPNIEHPPAHLPAFTTEADAIDLLNAELHNLVATARYAAEHGWNGHAWQIPCSLQPLFLRMNHHGDGALELFRAAERSARAEGSRRGEAVAVAYIAQIFRNRGAHGHARELLERAIAISREIGDSLCEAYLHNDLGIVHVGAGEFPDAYDSFTAAHAIAGRLTDPQGYAAFTNNLGVVCNRLGNLDEALTYFTQAMAGYESVGFQQGMATALINIGHVHLSREQFVEAADHLTRGLAMSREISYLRGEGLALVWLGEIHRRHGELVGAAECGTDALAVGRRTGLREVECDALNGLGDTYRSARRWDEAEEAHRQAERVARDNGLPLQQARAHDGLAHVAHARGDAALALLHWERALKTYPDGVADVRHVQRHINAPPGSDPRCRWC